MTGRCIGLDVYRDFCEVAAVIDTKVQHWPRVSARPGPLLDFAQQLHPENDGLSWPHCDGLIWPHLSD